MQLRAAHSTQSRSPGRSEYWIRDRYKRGSPNRPSLPKHLLFLAEKIAAEKRDDENREPEGGVEDVVEDVVKNMVEELEQKGKPRYQSYALGT